MTAPFPYVGIYPSYDCQFTFNKPFAGSAGNPTDFRGGAPERYPPANATMSLQYRYKDKKFNITQIEDFRYFIWKKNVYKYYLYLSRPSGTVRRRFGKRVIQLAKTRFRSSFAAEADLQCYVDHCKFLLETNRDRGREKKEKLTGTLTCSF